MASANARHTARKNLAALLHELRQDVGALVVDEVHLLDTELADLLLTEILALTAARAARTTRSARATFTPRTAVSAAGTMSTRTRTALRC
jgi:hypothetical protein